MCHELPLLGLVEAIFVLLICRDRLCSAASSRLAASEGRPGGTAGPDDFEVDKARRYRDKRTREGPNALHDRL
jgi:hypothetical protein